MHKLQFWVNYNDLTATSLGIMVNKRNHPQMAELFRLVKYSNLPRQFNKQRLDAKTMSINEVNRKPNNRHFREPACRISIGV